MAGTRDRVRVEADQRVDLGDWRALQENARTAIKMGFRALIFGASNPRSLDKAVQSEFDVTTAGALLTVSKGRAWAGEVLQDGTTYETGIVAGEEGDASQTLNFTGEPANTYYIYVRQAFDPGVQGSRVFWDAGAGDEVIQSIDTREVANWKAVKSTSGTPPDARYVQVGTVAWDGAAFTANNRSFPTVFEGNLTAGAEAADAWGDGANDRSTDRAQYGIGSLIAFADALRRQVKDILGTGNWFDILPLTTRGTPASASLSHYRDHYDTQQDPHGDMTLTGTTTIHASGTLDGNGTLDWDGPANIANLTIGTSLTLPTMEGEFSVQGGGLQAFLAYSGTWTALQTSDGGANPRYRYDDSGSTTRRVPVHIPRTGEITAFIMWGMSESGGAGASASLTMKLMRSAYAFVAWSTVEIVELSDNAPAGDALYDSDLTLSRVVNDLDGIWVQISVDNAGTGSSIGVGGFTVEYEATEVLI